MKKFIVVTGASKGIGHAAANDLMNSGWSVIGVARNGPQTFPGEFIETDLADRDKTQALADDLRTRTNVLGIVNNVGLARHGTSAGLLSHCSNGRPLTAQELRSERNRKFEWPHVCIRK
jgi:short-subunit dehydrogenase